MNSSEKLGIERLKVIWGVGSLIFMDFLIKKYFLLLDPYVDYGSISFYVIKNKGIAFGWLSGLPSGILLAVNGLIITVFVWLFFFKSWKRKLSLGGVGLVLAGALGNFIDRLLYGYVVDYIHLYKFPVFNLSDVMISLGVVGLLLGEII